MVAYSFNARFIAPIVARTKRQTIRADRKRHARAGEQLQLYTGMRTKACRLIGRAVCAQIRRITMSTAVGLVHVEGIPEAHTPTQLDAFAMRDGFRDWEDLEAFWRAAHGDDAALDFEGVLITWRDFVVA